MYHTVKTLDFVKFIMKLRDFGMDDLKTESAEMSRMERRKVVRLTYVVKKLSRVLRLPISFTGCCFMKYNVLDKPTESASHSIKRLRFLFQSFPTVFSSD